MTRPNRKKAIEAANFLLDKYCITDPAKIPFLALLGAEKVCYEER